MRVKEAMTRTVHTLTPDRPLAEAVELMKSFGIDHVIVVEHRKTVGVLSDGDVMRHGGATSVGEAMTRDLVTVGPDELISRAANLMRGHSIKCLIVKKGDKLAGVITTSDLLEIVGRTGHNERMVMRDRGVKHRKPRAAV